MSKYPQFHKKPLITSLIVTLFLQIQNMTPGIILIYQAKIGNNVSKFTHSNQTTKSYYLSPKHKSPLP